MVRDSVEVRGHGVAVDGGVVQGGERGALDGPVSVTTGMAILAKWGLTEREGQAVLESRDVSESVLKTLARVSPPDIAAAFSPEVVQALVSPGATVRLRPQQVARLDDAVERTQLAASVEGKLSAAVEVVDHAARKDASFLDEVVHLVIPQIQTQQVVDDTLGTTFESLLAYWDARYPGGPTGPRTAKEKADVAPAKAPGSTENPAK
jgi:hypothetical protein